MSSQDVNNMSERQLVRAAAVNSGARQQLKKELLPHVTHATKELMQKRSIPESREQELIEVGMEPFDRVFNIYLKNATDHNEYEGHFYSYYRWWMKKAIFEHLHSQAKPLSSFNLIRRRNRYVHAFIRLARRM